MSYYKTLPPDHALCGCKIEVTLAMPDDLTPDEIERGCYPPSPDDVHVAKVVIGHPCRFHARLPVSPTPDKIDTSPLTVRTPVNLVATVDSCDHLLFRNPDAIARQITAVHGVPVRSVVVMNTRNGLCSSARDTELMED